MTLKASPIPKNGAAKRSTMSMAIHFLCPDRMRRSLAAPGTPCQDTIDGDTGEYAACHPFLS
eukprot:gene30208-37338_t